MFVIDIIKLIIPKKDHDIVLKGYLSWFLVPCVITRFNYISTIS